MNRFQPLTLPAIEYEAVEDLGCELERHQLPFGCDPEAATFVDILDLYPEETPRWSRKNANGYYYIRDFSYPGHHLLWFSHSLGGHPVSTYITYNLPEAAWHAIVACAPQMLLQPLSVDLFFSRSLLRRNQQALWENQDSVFQLEEDHQLKSSLTPETATAAITQLHGVARAMHRFRADLCDLPSTGEMELSIESLEYLKSQIEVLLDQQTAGRERIATQIALFFNLSNQLDSRTNLDIARLTSEISVSTQRDSSSMITIAIVTMFFLPGTFISGFFSMVFVGSTPDAYGHPTIVVGPQVWIYFLATVVLTALVFCIWRLWFKQRAEQQARDLRSRELSRGVHLGIRDNNGTDVETETPPVRPHAWGARDSDVDNAHSPVSNFVHAIPPACVSANYAGSLKASTADERQHDYTHPFSSVLYLFHPDFRSTMDKFQPLTLPVIEYAAVEDLGCEIERYQLPSRCDPEAATFVDVLELYPEEAPRWNRKNANELPDLFPWMQQRFGVSPLFFRAAALPTFTSVQEHVYFPYRDQAGKATRLDGYYHLRDSSYPGHRLVWFSHSLGGEPCSAYITFNFPEAASRAIMACIPKALLQPLSLDLFFCKAILRLNQRALWQNQGSLFQLEEDKQLKSSLTPETAGATITQAVHFLCSIADEVSLNSPQLSASEMDSTTESLKYLKSQIEVILDQQTAGRERVATQIALFFNLSNQLDSRTNLDIARLTSEISVSTQRDSSSMITIAIVTMFFLPGTFISGFFSTVFVGSAPDAHGRPAIIVGPQVWIYFVATVVLTALVFCTWRLWFKQRAEQQARDLRSRELNRGVHLGIRENNGTDVEPETPVRVARNVRQKIRELAGGVRQPVRPHA
ncbi:hypothetical protein NLJ89_g4493 [Agrocybe chaxingu]|uniref:Uncharacterized protein n=1 Tax=Agrocybe chaxingu TaxID=84603 RepID=A0A9W8K0E8_9AGAR|nr:hypothetical protein NLJ89_g4493 [Agrocybe chaxingu]